MPYAPAVSVMEPGGLLFIAGATASPLYHHIRMCRKSTCCRTT